MSVEGLSVFVYKSYKNSTILSSLSITFDLFKSVNIFAQILLLVLEYFGEKLFVPLDAWLQV